MTDVLTVNQRSYNMSKIRGKNTTPEITVRRELRRLGLRNYRVHTDLKGKPDIVFPVRKLAVFIDGCFWHKCPVDYHTPATRHEFWAKKIDENVARDARVNSLLSKTGWEVVRIWEHEVRRNPKAVARSISTRLRGF
jgi:DNA mismatch endonuclease, patch repair protein